MSAWVLEPDDRRRAHHNRPTPEADIPGLSMTVPPMKSEVIHTLTFYSDAAPIEFVSRYRRRYNRQRLHSALGYRSPIDYERIAV